MITSDCRAATPVQIRDHVRAFLLDLTNDHSGPSSADVCRTARARLELRLRDSTLAGELPASVDAAGLALWADTLRLGLSSLVNEGMTTPDATAVVDIALRCLDRNSCLPTRSRQPVRATMRLSIQAPTLSSISRTLTVLGGEYAR